MQDYRLESDRKSPSLNLLKWVIRFIKNKATSLSVSSVTDKDKYLETILILESEEKITKQELISILKTLRKIGLPGLNSIAYPLLHFYEYIEANRDISSLKQIKGDIVFSFLTTATIGMSDATKKNWRNSIGMFLKYIEANNEDIDGKSHLFKIDLKGWGGLRGASGEKPPAYMVESEIKRFIDEVKNTSKNKSIASRNTLLIKIILYTGIRVSEAIGIRVKDIAITDGLFGISIRGKGNKYGVAYIEEDLIRDDFNEWIQYRDQSFEYLFHTMKGSLKTLTQAMVSRLVEESCIRAGIRKEKNGAHMLRHTFASLLYLKTGDIMLLQESLRHSDIKTSRKYTHLDKSKAKKVSSIFK